MGWHDLERACEPTRRMASDSAMTLKALSLILLALY